jgi:hypothetical protein
MEILSAYVKSRTVEEDYKWTPKSPIGNRLEEICNENSVFEWHPVIIQYRDKTYFMSEALVTHRKDHVYRTIPNLALLEVDSVETALALYDSNQALVNWSEKYFESIGKCGFSQVLEVADKTQKVSKPISFKPKYDSRSGAIIYALPKHVNQRPNAQIQKQVPKKSFLGRLLGR